MSHEKASKKLVEEVQALLERSARIRKESETIQEKHKKVLKRLQDNDDDLARLFKRLDVENKHSSR